MSESHKRQKVDMNSEQQEEIKSELPQTRDVDNSEQQEEKKSESPQTRDVDNFDYYMIAILLNAIGSFRPNAQRVIQPIENAFQKLIILTDPPEEDVMCVICQEDITNETDGLLVQPPTCQHIFHATCVETWFNEKSHCPVCRVPVTVITGCQPPHSDNCVIENESKVDLPGFAGDGTLELTFFCPSGYQYNGEQYTGQCVTTYLPNNSEGQNIARMLKIAFDRHLLFKLGHNPYTGKEDRLVSNGIELKTRRTGGPLQQGYPDPTYFCRLKIDLHEFGIY